MKIVKTQKFASKMDVVLESALKVAVRFNVGQTHCALQMTIDQHVFVSKVTKVIPLILLRAVTCKRCYLNRKDAMLLHVGLMKFAKLTIKVQFVIVKTALFGILLHQFVKSRRYLNVLETKNATKVKHADKMY